MRTLFICLATIGLLWPRAIGQIETAHMRADITIDLSGVPEGIPFSDVDILLNDDYAGTPDDTGQISLPLEIGPVALEARIEGYGSTRISFKVIPEITGSQPIRLTPNLAELLKDDLRAQAYTHHKQPPQTPPSALGTDLHVPANARFKLVNLMMPGDLGQTQVSYEDLETYCRPRIKMMAQHVCHQMMLGTYITRHKVHSAPAAGAQVLGTLVKTFKAGYGGTYFQPAGEQKLYAIPFDYQLSDWFYGGFGAAVQVHGLQDGYVAIKLPGLNQNGWLDLDDLIHRNFHTASDYRAKSDLNDTYIGFSPPGCPMYMTLDGKDVRVLKFDQDFIYYRDIQEAHDNWNIYEYDTPQPALEPFETHKVDWRAGYNADGKLTLLPFAAKEC